MAHKWIDSKEYVELTYKKAHTQSHERAYHYTMRIDCRIHTERVYHTNMRIPGYIISIYKQTNKHKQYLHINQ